MGNRIPYIVLAALVLVALVWRLANPPEPPLPGPLGRIPTWDSMTRVGDMGPSAVNPAGSMWAGAWNQETKDGKLRSAVWMVEFEKPEATSCPIKDGAFVTGLSWADDKTVRVLTSDAADPAQTQRSEIVHIDARTGRAERSRATYAPVAQVLAWPVGSGALLARLAQGAGGGILLLTASGEPAGGKPAEVSLPADVKFYPIAAISPDADGFVFGVEQDKVGGRETYYLVDSSSGAARRVFGSDDIPGRVEGMWLSKAGVLIAAAEREKLHALKFDPASGKLMEIGKAGLRVNLARDWPDAPRDMKFVTYLGGYRLDLGTGKTTRLFDLSKLPRSSAEWRQQVQDGRLYPQRGGDYTSVSHAAGAVDIRVIRKGGQVGPDILPRR